MHSKNDHSWSAAEPATARVIRAKRWDFRPNSVVEGCNPTSAGSSLLDAAAGDLPSDVPLSESGVSKALTPSVGTPRNDQFSRPQAIRSVIAQYLR